MSDQSLKTRDTATLSNISAEASIIGGMLVDNAMIDRLNDFLQEDDFSNPLHGRIFRIASQLAARGEAVNAVVLRPYFEQDAQMQDMGGVQYLVQITMSCIGRDGAKQLAEQVADLARRRRAIEAMQLAIGQLSNFGGDTTLSEVMGAVEAEIDRTHEQSNIVEKPLYVFANEAIEEWSNPEATIKCGIIPSFDKGCGSLRRGNLLIIAGRPGMGKTAVALSVARGLALEGSAVLFLSREMTGIELAERSLSDASYDSAKRLSYTQISNRWLNDSQMMHACRVSAELQDLPIKIIDAPFIKIGDITRRVRRWKRACKAVGQNPTVLIVDYLQLLDPDHKTTNQTDKISAISIGLKSIAKQEDILVVALSQLSREVEKRQDKRPQMSDLRDSGQIEQDADVVLFLYREAYYLNVTKPTDQNSAAFIAWKQKFDEIEHSIEMIFAKARKSVPSVRYAEFHGDYQAVRG